MGRKRVRTNAHVAKGTSTQGTILDKNETFNSRNKCTCTDEPTVHKQKSSRHVPGSIENKCTDDSNLGDNIFPCWIPWLIFPVTLTIRLFYVLEPTNWWILHPDEIFQTMEVAHSDAYGYGFRASEYLEPPIHEIDGNSTFSDARLQEIRLGLYSLRSFILPKLLAVVMSAADICGISWSPFLVVKVFHAVLTSTLPVTVFHLSRCLQLTKDTATLAAAFVSFSLSLNIFGTHTIINSFLSPFVMFSLLPYVRIVKDASLTSLSTLTTAYSTEHQIPRNTKNNISTLSLLTLSALKQIHVWCMEKTNAHGLQNNNKPSDGKDENANSICNASNSNLDYNDAFDPDEIHKQHTAYRTSHSDVWALFTIGSVRALQPGECLSGLLLALCVYIRVDIILVPLVLLLVNWNCTYTHFLNIFDQLKSYLFGILCGVVIGGSIDYVTYGLMFVSPMQWIKFNVLNDSAGAIFGVNHYHYYLVNLYEKEPLFIIFCVIVISEIVISCIVGKNNRKLLSTDSGSLVRAPNQSLFIFVCLLISYSMNSHKELRFLHNGIIFFYIAASRAIISLFNVSTRLLLDQNGRQYSIYSFYLFILLFSFSHMNIFLKMTHSDRAKWTYGGNSDSYADNICLDFIRNQNDVTGVFLDSSLKMSGAYSILHKKVPMFALNMYEFMEYNYRGSYDVTGKYKGIHSNGFTDFSDISEFISIYNTPYLLKQLIDKQEYNYLVLKTDRRFVEVGYKEVFRAGNSKVLKRKFDTSSEISLTEMSKRIMIGSNATVLEYEGTWLKHFGVYVKAEHRLVYANRLDSQRIGPFRILLDMYKRLSQSDSYKQVLSACLQLHTSRSCLSQSEPVILHANYFRNYS